MQCPLFRSAARPERSRIVTEDTALLILAELRALPSAIAEAIADAIAAAVPERRASTLNDDERAVLALLLPAISRAVGDRSFTTRELVHHAATVDPELRIAIERATMTLNANSARRIGKRLQRAEGLAMSGGLHVERCDVDREGVVWRVVAAVRLSHLQHIRAGQRQPTPSVAQ